MNTAQMLATHPDARRVPDEALLRCIEDCYACAQTCVACADACLAEPLVRELRLCIRLNLDCADVCAATGAVASRRTGASETTLAELLSACAVACRLCADECWKHSDHHEHCRICAEACRRCAEACTLAVEALRE